MTESLRLVGARTGAFVLTSDAGRRDWSLSGPYCETWPINHAVADPATGAPFGAGGYGRRARLDTPVPPGADVFILTAISGG